METFDKERGSWVPTCTEQSLAWLYDIKPTASATRLAVTWNLAFTASLCGGGKAVVLKVSHQKLLRAWDVVLLHWKVVFSTDLSGGKHTPVLNGNSIWFTGHLGNNRNKRKKSSRLQHTRHTLLSTLTRLENCHFSRNPNGVPSSYGYTHFWNTIINLFVRDKVSQQNTNLLCQSSRALHSVQGFFQT